MQTRTYGIALAALLLLPAAAPAQHVVADIRIGEGPISGRLFLGDPYGPSAHVVVDARRRVPEYHRPPAHREIVVYRAHRGEGWWRSNHYRTVRVWYDADRDYYYDHPYRDGRGLREVVLYERDGRYYRDDDRFDRNGRWDRDRDYDRGHDRDHGRGHEHGRDDRGYQPHDLY